VGDYGDGRRDEVKISKLGVGDGITAGEVRFRIIQKAEDLTDGHGSACGRQRTILSPGVMVAQADLINKGWPGPIAVTFAKINAVKTRSMPRNDHGADLGCRPADSDRVVGNIVSDQVMCEFGVSPGWLHIG
jgi:hypothetical protein